MSDKTKPNYFGSTWYNEYQGEFRGYTLYLTAAELQEAARYINEETGKVKIAIKQGRDPKKPYSVIESPQETAIRRQNAQAVSNSKPTPSLNDLPF
jgi:hypothetical protein